MSIVSTMDYIDIKQAPGKHYRQGLSLIELFEMFPDETSAVRWFASVIWNDGRRCGKCGSVRTSPVKSGKPMPYWCSDCRSYFSVKTGTVIAHSNVPMQKWAIAIYLCLTSLKSVSSMKLHQDLKVSQPTAWFMMHRIKEAWMHDSGDRFDGSVEVDETYVDGLEKNKHTDKKLNAGRGGVGKTIVVGAKERETRKLKAQVIENTKRPTLHGFIDESIELGSTVFRYDLQSYEKLDGCQHDSVKHSVGEYVKGKAHVNGVESFWAMLKRAHKGTFHKFSPKHLDRYVKEFAGRHNIRDLDTLAQMRNTVARLFGRNLLQSTLIANNRLDSTARS